MSSFSQICAAYTAKAQAEIPSKQTENTVKGKQKENNQMKRKREDFLTELPVHPSRRGIVNLATSKAVPKEWKKAIPVKSSYKSIHDIIPGSFYPPSSSNTISPLPFLLSNRPQLPYAAPSDLVANSKGHVFPSRFNAVAINSRQVPAKDRINHAPRLESVPLYPSLEEDTHAYSPASQWVNHKIDEALSDGVKERMGYALKSYHEFCSMEGIPDEERFPITTFRLKTFLGFQIGSATASSLQKTVKQLKNYSIYAQYPWKVDEDYLTLTFTAIRNFQPHPKLKRPPLLAQHLLILFDHVSIISNNLSDRYHLAMLTATVVAFSALLRGKEFTMVKDDPTEEDHAKKIKGKHVGKQGDAFVLNLPWDKSNQWNGAKCAVSPSSLNGRAVELLERHIQKNEIGMEDFLWSYRAGKGSKKGKRVMITKTTWLRWINKMLKEVGLPSLTGHSIRIGGATQLLINGIDPKVVQAAGRWKSEESFMLYWRHAEVILVLGTASGVARIVPEEIPFLKS